MKIKDFKIASGYELVVEENVNQLRLVILENGEELACRKTTKKELTEFFENGETNLFKGRLQLSKADNGRVEVVVKGKKG